MLLFGSQFELYRVWDCIRSVDYLLSRPEVDPERIGCTGQSGGGTMTLYAAALDPRIKVAVESDGNSENLAGPSYSPFGGVADAEQNMVGSLAEGIDRGDLALACAPRPFMILYSQTDSGFTYSPTYVSGTIEIYQQALAAYRLVGAQEKIDIFGSPLPHDYDFFNRRHAYQWFNRWLGSEDWGIEEAEFDDSPPGTLNCTSTGQVLTSLGGRSVVALNSDRLQAVRSRRNSGQISRSSRVADLKSLLAFPEKTKDLNVRSLSSSVRKNVVIEEFWLYSEPGVRVPGWFLKPARQGVSFLTVIYVSEESRGQIVYEMSDVAALVEDGFAVCGVDLRGLGDSTPRYPAGSPIFYRDQLADGYPWACFTLGKPLLGQRVWDLLRSLDYLRTRSDVDQNHIYGLGVKGAALAVLFAGVLDDRLHSVLLDTPLATYASIVNSREYSLDFSWFLYGILERCDLPDLVGLLAPRKCSIVNATDAHGVSLSESDMTGLYEHSIEMFRTSGAGNQLEIKRSPENERLKTYRTWLQEK
jgi:cephalosporin-C deacetylase-like acetyl esterase